MRSGFLRLWSGKHVFVHVFTAEVRSARIEASAPMVEACEKVTITTIKIILASGASTRSIATKLVCGCLL